MPMPMEIHKCSNPMIPSAVMSTTATNMVVVSLISTTQQSEALMSTPHMTISEETITSATPTMAGKNPIPTEILMFLHLIIPQAKMSTTATLMTSQSGIGLTPTVEQTSLLLTTFSTMIPTTVIHMGSSMAILCHIPMEKHLFSLVTTKLEETFITATATIGDLKPQFFSNKKT